MPDTPQSASDLDAVVACSADETFANWMSQLHGSLAVTTYQANRVALLGWNGQQVSLLMREFDKPMGMAVDRGRILLATRHEVLLLADAPLLAHELIKDAPGRYDALYLPRASFFTGDINVHDVGLGPEGLWLINTRFSCLSLASLEYSFVPRWQPPFISQLVPEDRCHLNGLAMDQGRPRFVSALGESDTVGGWREGKATGGIVMDVESGEIVLRGLSMPHSPRFYDGALWLLNSGTGEFICADVQRGTYGVVCALPGYLRGLCFVGPWAIVGLCQIRERHIFGGVPVHDRHPELLCGLAVIDLRTGKPAGLFRFTSGCEEIYDVAVLPNNRRPNILNRDSEATREGLTAPEFSYWLRPSAEIRDEPAGENADQAGSPSRDA
jgi:uncharacterized protein (TIGR03032 family)